MQFFHTIISKVSEHLVSDFGLTEIPCYDFMLCNIIKVTNQINISNAVGSFIHFFVIKLSNCWMIDHEASDVRDK